MSGFDFTVASGADVRPWIDSLARLRLRVFREFPYLYEGDLDYERHYLTTYTQSPRSVLVVARKGTEVVGVSSGTALEDETDEVKIPFIEAPMELSDIFYFGESVLEKSERGQGIGVRFMEERERHARRLGFKHAAFCAVERPPDHPSRPDDYQDLDAFWIKRGFTRTSLRTTFSWKELGEAEATAKPMIFWIKELV